MTEQSIAAEYNASVERAKQLDNAAYQLEADALAPLGLIIRSLPNDWVGDNADLYSGKCVGEKKKIQSTVDLMHSTANEMRRVAASVRDADLKELEEQRRREAAEAAAREAAAREAASQAASNNQAQSTSSSGNNVPRAYVNKANRPSSRVNSKRR